MQQTGKAIEKGFQNLKYKITGQKYHNNLLGESLEDMLRIATAKTLDAPDATVNQQIVETINNEVASGKDPKEVVGLLKARLRMDNPQKQFLAVKLVEQIMTDCTAVLGAYQQELLVEVARVMTKPAKPETEAGKTARQAAKELLRKYGQEGTTAFRAVHNEGRARTSMQPPGATGYPPVGPAYGAYGAAAYPPPGYGAQPPYGGYGVPGQPVYGAPAQGGVNVETQSIIDEVRLLIDKARSNTELLSDMLVSTSGTPDDFETELVKDLATEVRELREVFNAYLEQMSAIEDPAVESLLVQALEAVDMLDGAIALQKDVALNQQEFAAATAASRSDASATAAAAGGGAPAPAAAPQPAVNNDLIALDDLADAMTATSIQGTAPGAAVPGASGPSQGFDPFAASDLVPILSSTVSAPSPGAQGSAAAPAAAGPAPAGAPAAGPSQPIPLDSLYGAAPAPQAYGSLPPHTSALAPYGAPAYSGAGAPYPHAPPPGPAAAYPGASPAYPAPGYPPQYPGAPHAAPAPAPTYSGLSTAAYPGQPPAYGAAPAGPAPGIPPSPYATAGTYPGAQAPAQYPPAAGSFNSKASNPFQAEPAGGMFLPGPPAGITGSSNPFAAGTPNTAPAAAPAPAPHAPAPIAPAGPSVDHEWELFFADRAAGAAQALKPT